MHGFMSFRCPILLTITGINSAGTIKRPFEAYSAATGAAVELMGLRRQWLQMRQIHTLRQFVFVDFVWIFWLLLLMIMIIIVFVVGSGG